MDPIGKWNYGAAPVFPYGDDTTYRKAIDFLDGPYLIEDWGCLPSFSKVLTEDGDKTIKWIVENRYKGRVRSINEYGHFVWNDVVDWQSRKNISNKPWVRLKTYGGRGGLICTADHPVSYIEDPLQPDINFAPAGMLQNKFIVKDPQGEENTFFNSEQIAVLLGNMLGDGTISKEGSFRVKHGRRQRDYLLFNADIFNVKSVYEEVVPEREILGISVASTVCDVAQVPINGQTKYLRKLFYSSHGGKQVPAEILAHLTDASLAFWYMDDGNIWIQRRGKPNRHDRPIVELNTHRYSSESLELLRDWLGTKYGIEPYYRTIRRNGSARKVMLFRVNDSDTIFQAIKRYIPHSMQYKLPEYHRSSFAHNFNKNNLEYSAYEVKSISSVDHYVDSRLYDLTISKNHNFVSDGVVVHNCGTAYARRFVQRGRYIGLDGSWSMHCDQVVDLRKYRSKVQAILIRHILEHNYEWKKILENAMASFEKKLALVMFTPFGPETKVIGMNWDVIPDLSFRKEDLLEVIGDLPYTEESVETSSIYRHEHIFYVTRKEKAPPPADKAPAGPPRVSIVIPTYNHLEDLLKPNLESMKKYTDMERVEVIVVCNGCTDGSEDYVLSLGEPFRCLSFPEPLGFTRATNEGLKASTGDYLVLLNNDIVFLEQPRHHWVEQLLGPFRGNSLMGITGPLQLHDYYSEEDLIVGACLMISRPALEAAGGLLDETFNPGGGEDIDLCCKVRNAGFTVRQVPTEGKPNSQWTNVDGTFMLWHKNNQTMKDVPEYWERIVKKNGIVNMKRHNRKIRLEVFSRGEHHWGYLGLDATHPDAAVPMDPRKLDLDDQTVTEILAIDPEEYHERVLAAKISWPELLREWRRVLKPGGKLVLEMPTWYGTRDMFRILAEAGFPGDKQAWGNPHYPSCRILPGVPQRRVEAQKPA